MNRWRGGAQLGSILILSACTLRAQIVAVQSFSNGMEYAAPSGTTYGWRFTVGASSLSVSQLGLLDLGASGFSDTHKVGIWDSSKSLVAEATFAPGESGTLLNGFRYLELSAPVTLQAGQTYSIGNWSSDSSDHIFQDGAASFASDFTFDGESYSPDGGFSAPSKKFGGSAGVFGGNFQYTAVPEPREYGLATGLMLLGYAVYRRAKDGSATRS